MLLGRGLQEGKKASFVGVALGAQVELVLGGCVGEGREGVQEATLGAQEPVSGFISFALLGFSAVGDLDLSQDGTRDGLVEDDVLDDGGGLGEGELLHGGEPTAFVDVERTTKKGSTVGDDGVAIFEQCVVEGFFAADEPSAVDFLFGPWTRDLLFGECFAFGVGVVGDALVLAGDDAFFELAGTRRGAISGEDDVGVSFEDLGGVIRAFDASAIQGLERGFVLSVCTVTGGQEVVVGASREGMDEKVVEAFGVLHLGDHDEADIVATVQEVEVDPQGGVEAEASHGEEVLDGLGCLGELEALLELFGGAFELLVPVFAFADLMGIMSQAQHAVIEIVNEDCIECIVEEQPGQRVLCGGGLGGGFGLGDCRGGEPRQRAQEE